MNNLLPVSYLLILVGILVGVGWIIFRQVLKTQKSETRLSKLQSRLNDKPGTAQDYYELSGIYLDKKLYNQAVVQLQKALKAKGLKRKEDAAPIHNALGYSYFAQEQYDLAIRQYKEALKLSPAYVVALNNLGHVYERKQLTSQALDAYETVLKHDPKNGTAKRRVNVLQRRGTVSKSSD